MENNGVTRHPWTLENCRLQKNLWILFKLNCNLDIDYWKELNGTYDAANDLLMMNWLLPMKNLGRPDFMLQEKCRSYEPTRIRKEKPKERSEEGEARRDDSREGKKFCRRNKDTEDGVNFRGGGCNVPLIHP